VTRSPATETPSIFINPTQAMLRDLTESAPANHTNPEVADIRLFRELLGSFAGDLNRYFRDLY